VRMEIKSRISPLDGGSLQASRSELPEAARQVSAQGEAKDPKKEEVKTSLNTAYDNPGVAPGYSLPSPSRNSRKGLSNLTVSACKFRTA
jgi:hypothetical protein